jgi:hypothetical protein
VGGSRTPATDGGGTPADGRPYADRRGAVRRRTGAPGGVCGRTPPGRGRARRGACAMNRGRARRLTGVRGGGERRMCPRAPLYRPIARGFTGQVRSGQPEEGVPDAADPEPVTRIRPPRARRRRPAAYPAPPGRCLRLRFGLRVRLPVRRGVPVQRVHGLAAQSDARPRVRGGLHLADQAEPTSRVGRGGAVRAGGPSRSHGDGRSRSGGRLHREPFSNSPARTACLPPQGA